MSLHRCSRRSRRFSESFYRRMYCTKSPRRFVDMRRDTHTPCCWVDISPIDTHMIESLISHANLHAIYYKHFRCANTPSTPSVVRRILFSWGPRSGEPTASVHRLVRLGGMDGTFRRRPTRAEK